ncbi:hypothetical protein ACWKSP_13745 [Micromonosporaceae bacterium Da 78-11]
MNVDDPGAARRAMLAESCAVVLDADPHWPGYASTVRIQAAALAILRHAPAVAPVPPIRTWPTPLAPTDELTVQLAGDCYDAGLLFLHPDSPVEAFSWEPDGWVSFFPTAVSWYAPTGSSPAVAAERLGDHLVERLRPAALDRARRAELLDLVAELIAAETVRYFDFQLQAHQLPAVPRNHAARLSAAALGLTAARSLGEACHLASTAVRTAGMTVRAIDLFEARAREVTADAEIRVKAFPEDGRVPLSALTRTVLRTLLGADPMTTSRAKAGAVLDGHGTTAALEDEQDLAFTEITRLVLQSDPEIDPYEIYTVLGRESTNDDPVIATGATRLIQVVEDLRIAGCSLSTALGAAVSACRLLPVLVEVPDLWWGGAAGVEVPAGMYLAELMRQAAEAARPAPLDGQ